MYSPLEKAEKKWNICVSFPHMKDAYWLAVDYGVSEEAKDLGVTIHLVEAGGYTNLSKQISQIEDCASNGAQAVDIGAISFDGLNETVKRLKEKNIPVIDVINGMSSKDLSAKSLVSFETMGYKAGEYIAKLHPKGSAEAEVAWFPGPPGAGWVEAGNKGFLDATKDSALKVVATKYGDTGKEVQLKLVEDVLQANPNIKYIAGTSPTTEAAVQLLRERNLSDKVKVIAYYFTPGRLREHQGRAGNGGADGFRGGAGPRLHRPGGAHPRRQALSQARRTEDLRDRQVEHQFVRLRLVARAGRLEACLLRQLTSDGWGR